jgi:hypothetical protein
MMTEPRVICEIERKWGNPACQPHGLMPIHRNHSQYVQTIVIQYVITIVEIPNIENHEHRDILYLPRSFLQFIATFGYQELSPPVITKHNGVPSLLVQSVPRGPLFHQTSPPSHHILLPPPYGCMHYFWGKHGNAICIQAFICSSLCPLCPMPSTVAAISLRCSLSASRQLGCWCHVVISLYVSGWSGLGRYKGWRKGKWLLVHLANVTEGREELGSSCSICMDSGLSVRDLC